MVQIEPLISPHVTRAHITNDTNTSESYVMRAGWYAQGVDAAEEALPGIKQEILRPTYYRCDCANRGYLDDVQ